MLKGSQEGDAGPHQSCRATERLSFLGWGYPWVLTAARWPTPCLPQCPPSPLPLTKPPAPTGTVSCRTCVEGERGAPGDGRMAGPPPGPGPLRLCAALQRVPAAARHAVQEPLFKTSRFIQQTWNLARVGVIPEDSDWVGPEPRTLYF